MASDSKYPFAFGFLESAVHRALRELMIAKSRLTHALNSDAMMGNDDLVDVIEGDNSLDAGLRTLHEALSTLRNEHGIELHWPDDVKERPDV